MSITMKTVLVTLRIDVTVDESKFTPEFMQEFREGFFDANTIDEHREHLAQMHARGICDDDGFIEGYGPAQDMGIKFNHIETDTEIE